MDVKILLLTIFVIGIADASYLTFAHYTNSQLYCSNSGIVNCQEVTTSRFSTILGVPIALMGLVWFVVAFILLVAYKKFLVPWQFLGIMGAAYSISAMASLGKICEYCSLLDALLLISAGIVLGYGLENKGKKNA
ncbi:MAG: vitamin K epoxide reductase family protein [Candidatus Micrarchaeaceae archaeon]